MKFGMLMRLDPLDPARKYNFAISKIQDGGGGHLDNSTNRNTFATDGQILIKIRCYWALQAPSANKILRMENPRWWRPP